MGFFRAIQRDVHWTFRVIHLILMAYAPGDLTVCELENHQVARHRQVIHKFTFYSYVKLLEGKFKWLIQPCKKVTYHPEVRALDISTY